jgi:hypothetical protein
MSKIRVQAYLLAEQVLGEQKTRSIYKRLCIRRLQRAGCIFVHIPKAAGTSVAEATIGRRAGHFTAAELRSAMQRGEFDSLFSFAVTRNPWDRLVSAYNYARHGGAAGGIRPNRVYTGREFRSFDAFVNEWLVFQDLSRIDYIFRPQADFVFDGGQCIVDYVGAVERLEEVQDMLSAKLNRPITLARKNIGVPFSAERERVSRHTRKAVYDLYRTDFVQFGYSLKI